MIARRAARKKARGAKVPAAAASFISTSTAATSITPTPRAIARQRVSP